MVLFIFGALISTTYAITAPLPGLDYNDQSYIISINGRNVRVKKDEAKRIIVRSIRWIRDFDGQAVIRALDNLRGYARWMNLYYTGATRQVRAELADDLNRIVDLDVFLFPTSGRSARPSSIKPESFQSSK